MAKGVVVQISGDGEGAKRALEMVRDQLRQTQHETSATTELVERMKGAFETVGLYMGIREGIDLLKEMTAGSAEYGEQMQKAAIKTGMTVETLSVLHYAADLAHTDFDQLQSGIAKMAINLESAAGGNKKMAAGFQAVGIDAKDLAGKSDGVDTAFKKLTSTLANTENAQRRDAVAKQLMGKAGVELIPVLMDVGKNFGEIEEGATKAGVKMDQLRAEQLAKLDDALDILKENAKGAGLGFTSGLIPALETMYRLVGSNSNGGISDLAHSIGEELGKGIANATAELYGFEHAWYAVRAAAFRGIGGAASADASEMEAKAAVAAEKQRAAVYFAQNGKAMPGTEAPTSPPPKRTGAGAGEVGGGGTGKEKSGNPIDEARAQLVQEQARLRLEIIKADGQAQLAEVDAQHKMLLFSDQEFFDRKLAIQNKEYDAEQKALESRQATLQALETKQHGDKLLKRDKTGTSAQELKTQKELVQVQEQMAALDAKRKATESGYGAEVNALNVAAELTGLRAAAMLERERNSGIEAQIALIQKEHALEAQKSTLAGGSAQAAADIRAQGDLAAAKLRVSDAGQTINDTESEYRRRIDDVNDRASKGYLSQTAAKRQIAALNKQEAAALDALVQKYKELAQETGDSSLIDKAKDAQEQLNQLQRPDRNDTFGKKLTDGMQQMSMSIAENAAMGKQSFSEMAKSILDDVDRMALKMAEQKFLQPLFDSMGGGATGDASGSGGGFGGFLKSMFGAGGEHHASGGVGSDMPQIVGDAGGHGEIWTPPTRGGQYTTSAVLKRLAEGGGSGGAAPNVTTNVINQSSQPVTATTSQPSWDSQLREMVTHVVLTDMHEGGPIAQGFGR